jgi:hypothetical protein
MDMSRAATAPVQPHVSDRDRAHPLFPIYNQVRAACSRLLVQADSFRDWLYQYEHDLKRSAAAADPRYPRFLDWMQREKGGARKCPAGVFPHNFYFWIEGGRW